MHAQPRLRDLFQPHLPKPVVIFDLDGTLLSLRQEGIYSDLYHRALSRMTGLSLAEAERLLTEAYHATGNGPKGLEQTLEGWTPDHSQRLHRETSLRYRRTLPWHLVPHDDVNAQLERLARRTSALGLLTANTRDHMAEVVAYARFDRHLHAHLTLSLDCAGAHKNQQGGYDEISRRINALYGPETPRIMVEDSAPNLPAAKRAGFRNIHVGTKPVRPEAAASIDDRFPNGILPALREMNMDTL